MEEVFIWMVDDSEPDFLLTEKAFQKSGLKGIAKHIDSSEEAENLLIRDDLKQSDLPKILLLDINMPGTDGISLLKKLREQDATSKLPIIMLSNSTEGSDVRDCYAYGASAYLSKPISINGLTRAVEKLVENWFNIAVLEKPLTFLK